MGAGTPDHDRIASILSESFRPASLAVDARRLLASSARLLAEGHPVPIDKLAGSSGLSWQAALQTAAAMERFGLLLMDDRGRVTGAIGLSLQPTAHRLRVGDQQLYTWCALDALFLPAVLGRTAVVESICPGSGRPVRLEVSPDAVDNVEPAEAVVSLVIPGLTPGVPGACPPKDCGPTTPSGAESVAGPEGSFCTQVHFFASADAASGWLAGHPGAALLTPGEAQRVGRAALATPLLADS